MRWRKFEKMCDFLKCALECPFGVWWVGYLWCPGPGYTSPLRRHLPTPGRTVALRLRRVLTAARVTEHVLLTNNVILILTHHVCVYLLCLQANEEEGQMIVNMRGGRTPRSGCSEAGSRPIKTDDKVAPQEINVATRDHHAKEAQACRSRRDQSRLSGRPFMGLPTPQQQRRRRTNLR